MRDIAIARDQEAIIAQCTPTGSGALALLRISGINACAIAAHMSVLADGQTLDKVPTHTIHYGWVVAPDGVRIDNVLFFVMHGPKTFTGQDTVEITCHNNAFIIENCIELALSVGARLAGNGEFSQRAVSNGKMDVIQAEGINELIHAQTQMGLKQALGQVNGSFSQWIGGLEKQLIKALAFCEASFEFIDEGMAFDQQIKDIVEQVLATIHSLKVTFNKQNHIRQGVRIAIIGSVNVGKSSLFNALLHQNRSIVTNIAGTTRDVVEAGLYKGGNYWTLIDTAGLRETADLIEQEGIERAFEQAELADILLLVFDGSRPLTGSEGVVYKALYEKYLNKIIYVRNKADLFQLQDVREYSIQEFDFQKYSVQDNADDIVKSVELAIVGDKKLDVSTNTGTGVAALEQAIAHHIKTLFASIESPFLLNKRHYSILFALERELLYIQSFFGPRIQYELVSYHIKEALSHCAELTGKSISEQGMDAVFREFCVGK